VTIEAFDGALGARPGSGRVIACAGAGTTVANQKPAAPTPSQSEAAAPPAIAEIIHPVLLAHRAERAANVQLRIADAITKFAGTMTFVYIHAVAFAVWMIFFEKSPWQTLTLIVSLEAIFLSTFVMIGQNRQSSFASAKANHDFVEQETELKHNTQLTQQIHALTKEIHSSIAKQ
jgi:uncharacterized membrane protein